jgi:hypothetical protein
MSPRYVALAPIVHEMKTHVRVTAAALILAGLATGCQRTTEGAVAMTTEPGPPIASGPTTTRAPSTGLPGLPNIPGIEIPGIEIPGLPNTDLPEVPAPPNALTMTCSEYNDLDEATQLAVIRAILAQEGNPLGPEDEMVALLMANSMCQFLPDAVVSDMVLGGSPP